MQIINNTLYEINKKDIINGTVKIPSSIKIIDICAFCNLSNLIKIEIPYGVKRIEKFAFKNCENLYSITLPDSLKYIDTNSFEKCDNLKIVNVTSYKTLNVLKGFIKLLALNTMIKNNQQFSKKGFISYIKEHKDYVSQIALLKKLRYLFPYILENNVYTRDELLSMIDSITNDTELRGILLNHTRNNENNIETIIDDKFNLDDEPKKK